MIPTSNYSTVRRTQVQKDSKIQQSRGRSKHREFIVWLQGTKYTVKSRSFQRLTDRTTFLCTACGTSRQNTPFSMWRYGVAPRCLTCEFDQKLRAHAEYVRVGPYSNQVILQHECGSRKEYVAGTFLRGASYCDCLRNKITHTPDSYKQQVERVRDYAFKVEQKYINSKTPIWHRHVGGCGVRFKQTPAMFLAGVRCPACETGVLWTPEETEKALLKKYGKSYSVTRRGATVRHYWRFKHTLCGKEFRAVPEYLIHKSQTAVPCLFCQNTPSRFYIKRRQNKRFMLQGTEVLALDYIIGKGIPAKNIVHGRGRMPVIAYTFDGQQHHYYPDFYVEDRNIVVESKDLNSFGLGQWFDERVYERNCAKARAVIAGGYRFKMLVFFKGTRVVLPPRWWAHSKHWTNFRIDQSVEPTR